MLLRDYIVVMETYNVCRNSEASVENWTDYQLHTTLYIINNLKHTIRHKNLCKKRNQHHLQYNLPPLDLLYCPILLTNLLFLHRMTISLPLDCTLQNRVVP